MLIAKLAVYLLIVANFGYYVIEDWVAAQHALPDDATFLDLLGNYASSLDDFAWIALLLIFEIETWWLDDEVDKPLVVQGLRAGKLVMVALILHTSYTYIMSLLDWREAQLLTGLDLCTLQDQSLSFYRNLGYLPITADSCAAIQHDSVLFRYPGEPLVTDAAGLAEDGRLRIADLVENTSWLLIVALLQAAVHLQNRGIYQGPVIFWITRAKLVGYAAIISASVYWISKGHYIYAWDEFLWIAGFMLLERNLSVWRSELARENFPGAINANGSHLP